MDRRTFIQSGLGMAGLVALEACRRKAGVRPLPSYSPRDVNTPAARPAMRLAADGTDFPSPYAYGPSTYSSVLYIYDTLLVKDAAGNFVPWLASRFDRTPDGAGYTFELRDNARWHDGQPVIADDVAFSFEYFARNQGNLPPTIIFPPTFVKDVKLTGPRTGEIRLTQVAVSFPDAVGQRFPIVPKHVWQSVGDPGAATGRELLIGSGPYKIESLDLGKGTYSFIANDDFYLGKPFVKAVKQHQVDDELLALKAGDVDAGQPATGAPTRQALAPFRGDPAYGVVVGKPDFFAALLWNCSKPGPTSDLRFRKACALAIDRREMVARVLQTGEAGNPGFLPKAHKFRAEVEQYAFNLRRANWLLDEAGYKKGSGGLRRSADAKPLTLRLLTFPELEAAAEIVRSSLRKIGIQIMFDPTDFFRAMASGALKNFEMALQFFGGASGDADLMRQAFSSRTQGAGNGIFHTLGWKNPQFDDLAEKQLGALDENERKGLFAQMQQILAAELPVLPLYYANEYYVYRRSVFDQWSGNLEDRVLFVTGKKDGRFPVRPIKEA